MFKKVKIILVILLVISIFNIYEYIDYKSHEYVINNIFYENKIYNKVEYIGYIEIKSLNIKREIVKGINDKNLISHVALNDNCSSLKCNNIILAGHAVNNIFGKLKYIKKGDIINIVTYSDKTIYEVKSIDIVSKDEKKAIDDSELILITCNDFFKRIIVRAKKISH